MLQRPKITKQNKLWEKDLFQFEGNKYTNIKLFATIFHFLFYFRRVWGFPQIFAEKAADFRRFICDYGIMA